jgi:hypothetical protein
MAAFKSADSYRRFAKKVKSSRRYLRDDEDQEFFAALLQQAQAGDRRTVLKKGTTLWRAQLDYDLEKQYVEGEYVGDVPCPLPRHRMKPLRDRAVEGRANPKGIPCLYLSNRKETALSEVRPWLGSLISLAQFETTRELAIVDCSTDERPRQRISTQPPFIIISPDEWNKAVWYDIDQAFSKPVTRDDETPDYVPTQVIAELFKSNGFDGLAYQSKFGQGHNLALFDLDAADLINCGLEEVEEIKFSFQPAANPYFITKATP